MTRLASNGPLLFATLLRTHRRTVGFSQAELARRAGYSTDYISMLERGIRAPSPATINALARALGLDAARRAELVEASQRDALAEPIGLAGPLSAVEAFVGRTNELRVIQEHLAGHGAPLLLLSGEPGIGKTRLLEEARRLAPGLGLAVAAGAATPASRAATFAPVVEALLHLIHQWPRRQLRAKLSGCDWLTVLLPELASLGLTPPGGRPRLDQKRRLVFGAIARFLANIAGPRGTLLLLDDLHWADIDTIDLLAFLQSFAPQVRLLGAYRQTEVSAQHPLWPALAEGLRRRQTRWLRLGPLAVDEARALVRQVLGEESAAAADIDRMVERAEGVPRYLVGLAEAWRDGALASSGLAAVPDELAQIIRPDLGALPAVAREVLCLVAAGEWVASDELYQAIQQPHEAVLAALELLTARGLLREERGQGYQVARTIVRDVIRQDTGAARLEALRRRLAAAGRKRQV